MTLQIAERQQKGGRVKGIGRYYPYGLTMAGISDKALKTNYVENKLRYNSGNELQNKEFSDGSGFEAYDAENRMYDPQLGRFWQIDSLADIDERYSPYSFADDNPILLNDPIGLLSDSTHPQVLPAATVTHAFNRLPDKATTVTTGLADTKGSSMDIGEVAGAAPSTSALSAGGNGNSSENGNGMAMVVSVGTLATEGSGTFSGVTITGGGSLLEAAPPLLLLAGVLYLGMGIHPTGPPSSVPIPHSEISIPRPYIDHDLIRRLHAGAEVNLPAFPGYDPLSPPPGYQWRGKPGSLPGSKEGNYYNPDTGECLRPELDHPYPIGPHWDYKDVNEKWHRVYPDGTSEQKKDR